MKALLILVLFISSTISINPNALAGTVSKSNSKKNAKATKKVTAEAKSSNLGTSFSFDPASVRGKYKIASQGIATVEDEKLIDDLLGVRKSFKDREDQELSRR